MFAPLAFTKTYAMAAAAALSITLVPVLMGYFIRGKIRSEQQNPINRWLIAGYRPLLRAVLAFPKTTLLLALLTMASALWPLDKIGSEFMPPLDEGDLMYMPTTYPGISVGKARATAATDRPANSQCAGSEIGIWQNRPRRDCHRPRAPVDDRDLYSIQRSQ